jgi:hypothetical protein
VRSPKLPRKPFAGRKNAQNVQGENRFASFAPFCGNQINKPKPAP